MGELIFGEDMVTTGASNDFQQVARTARLMVTQLGFSDKIGQLCIGGSSGPSFLGQEMGQGMSMETMDVIDSEVRALVRQAYRRAKDLIVSNMAVLHKTADVLLEKENINGQEFEAILIAEGGSMYLKDDSPETTVPYSV